MNRPLVFAPQEPMKKDPATGQWVSKGLNLAATAEYGDLLIIWPPDAPLFSRETIEGLASTAAERYDDRRDWIVALGSPSLIAAFAHAIGARGKQLRILEWDRGAQRYVTTLGESISERNTEPNGNR